MTGGTASRIGHDGVPSTPCSLPIAHHGMRISAFHRRSRLHHRFLPFPPGAASCQVPVHRNKGRADMSISNTKILVVGGGSGMGLALARHCLQAGARVIIAGRGGDRLQQAREALGNPAGLDVAAVDIAREDEVAALFQRLGGLDHIVSTAADIAGAYQLLPALELAAAQRVVESKLYGPLLLAKHGAPKLASTGSMTFVSGVAAYRPAARGSVVAAVNAALEGLVRALAVELAPIRVNAVSPGGSTPRSGRRWPVTGRRRRWLPWPNGCRSGGSASPTISPMPSPS